MKTSEIDTVHLAKCLTSSGTLNTAYVGEHFNDTPGWSTLAAEVLRLTALVADLTAAKAALVQRLDEANVLADAIGRATTQQMCRDALAAFLAGGAA